jgi:hypothetical protein
VADNFKAMSLAERMDQEAPLGIVGDKVVEASDVYGDDEENEIEASDAAPRTLYVRRDLMNGAAVLAHFRAQLPDDVELQPASSLHVTIAYSKTAVDWVKQPHDWYGGSDEKGWLRVKPGGMRLMERLGAEDPRAAVVMQFASTDLTVRWRDFREDGGCSWDFEDYQPHITIAWDKDQVIDVSKLKPWTGELVFGPEVWEEVDEDWKAKTGIDE